MSRSRLAPALRGEPGVGLDLVPFTPPPPRPKSLRDGLGKQKGAVAETKEMNPACPACGLALGLVCGR